MAAQPRNGRPDKPRGNAGQESSRNAAQRMRTGATTHETQNRTCDGRVGGNTRANTSSDSLPVRHNTPAIAAALVRLWCGEGGVGSDISFLGRLRIIGSLLRGRVRSGRRAVRGSLRHVTQRMIPGIARISEHANGAGTEPRAWRQNRASKFKQQDT